MSKIDAGLSTRRQFVAAVLAALLGAVVLAGAFFTHSAVTSTVDGVVKAVVTADAYVGPKDASVADIVLNASSDQAYIDSATVSVIAQLPDVASVVSIYIGPVTVQDQQGDPISPGLAPSLAIGAADDGQGGPGTIIEGVAPTSVKQVALEKDTASRLGLVVGDTVTLVFNGVTMDNVTVSGLVAYDGSMGGAIVVVLSPTGARALFAPPNAVPFIAVTAQTGVSAQQLQDSLAATLASAADQGGAANAEATLGPVMQARSSAAVAGSLWWLNACLIAAAVLTMAAAGFLVANVFASAQRERRDQNRLLLDLGATPGQIVRSVAAPAGLIGLIGSVIAVVVTLGLALLARALIAGMGLDLGMGWLWLGLGAVITVLASIVVAIGSAILGARSAVVAADVDALVRRFNRARMVGGVVALIVGVGAGVWGLTRATSTLWYSLASVLAVLVALALLGPVLVVGVGKVFAIVAGLFSSLQARLAKGDLSRHASRAATVLGVFTVTIAAASAVLVLADSAASGDQRAASQDVVTPFVVSPTQSTGYIASSVVGLMSQTATGTTYASFGRVAAEVTLPDQDRPTDATVMYGPPDTFATLSTTQILEGTSDAFSNGVAVSKAFAEARGVQVGDVITFDLLPDTPFVTQASLPVGLIVDTAVFRDMMVPQTWITSQKGIPASATSQLLGPTLVLVTVSAGVDLDATYDTLTEIAGRYRIIQVQTRDDFIAGFAPAVSQTRFIGWAVAVFGLVAALLVTVNLFGFGVNRRRHDIGLLKALGAPDKVVSGSVVTASVIIAASGGLIGLVVGLGLAFLARHVVPALGVTAVSVPWLWLLGLFLLCLVIGWLGGLIPARQAVRLPALGRV
ncbi:MAG: FtsX-like permease family protein [Propionibacteriaceae bacterium]|jgi:putative ABC transport system permease protein|nr:FtsX-like permease family protein [Propionibacteriaceae bacterium]